MRSYKEFHLNVIKEENYIPVSRKEKRRLKEIMIKELVQVVNRFDGSVSVTINIEAKGNI